mmetsp:Transcript_47053/g.100719  ORF Transcript_47053/g.100719 Transcript_47053/m.100719 type:complete len:373 (+) Transcript_47053:98-1216(+)|eukprot:CAMPEP_0206446500 /NCGR_PEP_ID=MMETSP0324_2-20121206/16172_1 /ASSEMBLY_ACC=CAM_ASM_000836 /TAXON_ID=2866 /ORGANISM="Crypthecodinium cohnii, Strain Seligo" /LENGTH=372 /DNA_ID=CAMNT_0053914981 /DNA_START=80 /DNA_END=1198 /DNA_ORIENTATION=-
MMLLAGASLVTTSEDNLSTAIQQAGLPYFAIMGLSTFVMGIVLATTGGARKLCALPKWQWKWVFARGFAGAARQSLTLMAISTGAPMGDISALQSVNVVVSAVLGRALLGEPMRKLHALGLACSVVGAALISKPTTLIGLGAAGEEPHWLGYGLALLGGTSSGVIFIAARKLQGVSGVVPVNSVLLQQSICLWFLSFSSLAHDPSPFSSVAAKPLASFGVCVLTIVAGGSTFLTSLGGMWCPAAASSTIYTSVGMTVSYIFQVALQGKTPDVMGLSGAFLMFAAVVIMAFARWYYVQLSEPESIEQEAPSEKAATPESDLQQDEDDENFVTFIASEFSGISNSSRRARLRPAVAAVAAAAANSPQVLGLATA